MLLSDAIRKYLVACVAEGKARLTRDSYGRNPPAFLDEAGDIDMKEVDAETIQSHIVGMIERKHNGHSLSSDTILKRYAVLRSFTHFTEEHGFIDFNPMQKMKPPKLDQKLPRFLIDEQIMDVMGNLKDRPRDRMILTFFLTTGCRLFEVSNLTVDDLNFDQNFIKNEKPRLSAGFSFPVPETYFKK